MDFFLFSLLISCALVGIAQGTVMKHFIQREWWPVPGCSSDDAAPTSVVVGVEVECLYAGDALFLGLSHLWTNATYVKHECAGGQYHKKYFTVSTCAGTPVKTEAWPLACTAEMKYDGYEMYTCGNNIRSVTYGLYSDAVCTIPLANEANQFVVPHKQCNRMGGGSSNWALQGNKLTHNSYPEKDDCSGSSDDFTGQMEITWDCTAWPSMGPSIYAKIVNAAPSSAGSVLFALVLSMAAAMNP